MSLPSIFDLCVPREDVVKGTIADSDYAANLANVLNRTASRDYTDAPTFFTNTYPTVRRQAGPAGLVHRLDDAAFPGMISAH